MKLLVFSDSHLDRFEEKKLNFIESLLKKADRVIVNGDFWEGYGVSFDWFVNSPWKTLFPLMRKKKTIYLFGNHDKKILSDGRASRFSISQKLQHKEKFGDHIYVFEHGNRFIPYIDDKWNIRKLPTVMNNFLRDLEGFYVKRFGKEGLKKLYGKFNKKIKEQDIPTFKKGEIVFTGHTHLADIDLKNRFVNSGFIRHGLGQAIWIEKGNIKLQEEWYDK